MPSLQVYDVLPFKVGPFLQSGLVPLVLAPIWVLYVYLQPLMDNVWPGVSLPRLLSVAQKQAQLTRKTWDRQTHVVDLWPQSKA